MSLVHLVAVLILLAASIVSYLKILRTPRYRLRAPWLWVSGGVALLSGFGLLGTLLGLIIIDTKEISLLLPGVFASVFSIAYGLWQARLATVPPPLDTEGVLRRYESLYNYNPDGICEVDKEGVVVSANERFAEQLGRPLSAIVGRKWTSFVAEESREPALVEESRTIRGEFFESRLRFRTARGDPFVAAVKYIPISSKPPSGFHVIVKDVTDLVAAEEALRVSEERYRSVVETMDEGVMITDAKGRILSHNPACLNILEITGEELLRRSITSRRWKVVDRDGNPISMNDFPGAIALRTGEPASAEVLGVKGPGGALTWLSVRAKPIQLPGNGGTGALITFTDITNLRRAEETIRRLAFTDDVTGLPNRRLFSDRLERALAQVRREGGLVGVLFLDLDGFKDVNDLHGHERGDTVLRMIAQRLKGVVRESDTVARYGGDEFLVLLPSITSVDGATVVAQKILRALESPFELGGGKQVRVSASIGISLYPLDADNGQALLERADLAMYRAKNNGKSQYALYGQEEGEETVSPVHTG